MRNLVFIFAILGLLLFTASGCAMRIGERQVHHRNYNNRTARHFGARSKIHTRRIFWTAHRGGFRGYKARGRYH